MLKVDVFGLVTSYSVKLQDVVIAIAIKIQCGEIL